MHRAVFKHNLLQVLLGDNDTTTVSTTSTESAPEVVNIDYESDSEFVILDNPIGAGGECRRNYHCRGRERCVLRFREYMSVPSVKI